MHNPWKLYDELIEGIPAEPTIKYYQGGYNWSRVVSSEDSMGLAMTIPMITRPALFHEPTLAGKPLREAAQLVKSWNFVEAALGMAAINSWYNQPKRAESCGFVHPNVANGLREAFDVYFEEVQGKKVCIVGHFPFIEKRFSGYCDLSILERNPDMGDYPDPACEYILPEQNYVFITGSTFVNKTLPRLLALSQNARVVIVGPSTPLAPILFERGVYGLSGFTSANIDKLEDALRGASNMTLFDAGLMVDQMRVARLSCSTYPSGRPSGR